MKQNLGAAITAIFLVLSVCNGATVPQNGRIFPEQLYEIAYSFTPCCEMFKGYTLTDMKNWVDDIATWKAPTELQKRFPYYLAGYDSENRTIWIFEFGKYDFRQVVKEGPEAIENLEKWFYQAAINYLEASLAAAPATGMNITEGYAIMDSEGFNLAQFTHSPTFAFVMQFFNKFSKVITDAVRKVVVINANFPPELVTNYGKLIFGDLVKKIKIYGRNKAKWTPVLQELIPEQYIPTWYGGNKDYKPVKVFG
jgi:hypothetical protein